MKTNNTKYLEYLSILDTGSSNVLKSSGWNKLDQFHQIHDPSPPLHYNTFQKTYIIY